MEWPVETPAGVSLCRIFSLNGNNKQSEDFPKRVALRVISNSTPENESKSGDIRKGR